MTSSKLRKKREVKSGIKPGEIAAGDTVELLSHGIKAFVLKEPKDGSVYVQAGVLKLTVPLDEVVPVKPDKQVSRVGGVKRMAAAAGLEIDVRGMALDEAILETDKYLDDAFLSGLTEVSIIHGKGTGVLRAGIQDFLRKHHHVEGYRLGRYGEGESGVTIVTLKPR
jgi:DNA mismatch repair protein MutS2